MSKDELLDLVDKEDQVIGQIWRSESNRLEKSNEGYLRAATALIQNSLGELWIPRRTKEKRIAPLGLDASMQEHVGAGESYEEAVVRGFSEELGIVLSIDELEYVGKIEPTSELYYFVALFRYRSDDEPSYNPDDFISAEWVKPEILVDRLAKGEKAKDSLMPIVKLLMEVDS